MSDTSSLEETRRWLADYDLQHSSCPVDRRRAEKQQQEQARQAEEQKRAQEQQRTTNWLATIDQRIDQYIAKWWGNGEDGAWRDTLFETIGESMAMFVGEKLQAERRSFDAKLAALEERLWQLATGPASSQGEIATHDDDQAKRGVMIKVIDEVLSTRRVETREWLIEQLEAERRSFAARLAEMEQRLWQLATGPASHQGEIATHDDEAKRGVMIGAIDEALSTRRVETREWVMEQIEAEHRNFDAKLAEVEQRCKDVPGKLPVAKTWREQSVSYQAEFVSHNGALYQARRDTATEPGGKDWIVVARAGRDGRSPTIRGKFDVREKYQEFDIVTCDGFAFTAVRDDPGICPGHGWELISRPGRPGHRGETGPQGPRGERGMKGDQGDSALEIASWLIDRERYRAIPIMSNGQPGPALELRPLFERFIAETGYPGNGGG